MAGIKGKRIIKVQPKVVVLSSISALTVMMRKDPEIRRAMYDVLKNESHKTDKKEES